MRNMLEILSEAKYRQPYDTLLKKHSSLVIEVLCDMRDEQIDHNNRMERLAAGGTFMDRSQT